MGLAAKERFDSRNLSIKISDMKKIPFSYKYKDKSKTYTKNITLRVLGESLNNDLLIGNDGSSQYITTDTNGELYEACISADNVMTAIRSLRKPDAPKKSKENDEEDAGQDKDV